MKQYEAVLKIVDFTRLPEWHFNEYKILNIKNDYNL